MSNFPQLGAMIDFTDGAIFVSSSLTLDSATLGKLNTGQLSAATDNVDISDIITNTSIRRGRNRMLDAFEAGSATITMIDDNGDWNGSNVTSPYYGKLLPLRKIKIFADYAGIRYDLFAGFITAFTTQFKLGSDGHSYVTLQCVDGFRLLSNIGVTSIAGTAAHELSGTRISTMLDDASWPSSLRVLDAGQSTMQADPATQRTMLGAIQTVSDKSEFGAFFMDKPGNAHFIDRHTLATKLAQTPTFYDDTGSHISYQDVAFAHDDQFLVNDVSVTRLGGSVQEVSDAESINTYYRHSGIRTDVLVETDAEALNMANMILATRKDALNRIDSLTLNLFDSDNPTRIVAGLSTEIFDVVNVSKTMPGGSNITKELFVQGVQHDITKRSFVTKVLTAEPILKGLILNDAGLGALDSSDALLSY